MIGLDVDGVLYKWGEAARLALHERFGVDVADDVWFTKEHVTDEQWDWLWSDEGVTIAYTEGSAYGHAQELTRGLRELDHLRVITATPHNAQGRRMLWLQANRMEFDTIRFVDVPKDGLGSASKSEVLPHCKVYIDDNVNNVCELADNTDAGLIVLVDHKWNRGDLVEGRLAFYDNIVRCRLKDVVTLVKEWYDRQEDETEEHMEEPIDATEEFWASMGEHYEEELSNHSLTREQVTEEETQKETIAQEAHRLVHGQREDDYGHPRPNMQATAGLIQEYLRIRYAGQEVQELVLAADDAAVMMLLMKVARYAAGRHSRDTVVDMAGYAAVLGRVLELDE